jgi:uncharacterized cupin superfamily protein
MKYLRSYTSPDGESHFEDLETEQLAPLEFIPGMPSMDVSAARPATAVVFARFHAAGTAIITPTPRRQFVFTIAGEAEVVVSGGEMRRMRPGTVWPTEDTKGKVHLTRVTDKGEWLIALVWLAE